MELSILKGHKGQATPEVILGVGTILFLFILIAIFTLNNQIELGETADYIEKRSECLKMANLINSVYISGPGTEIRTHTDYLITTFNSSQISVQGLATIEEYGDIPRIAFLASEAGPTLQSFYNEVNTILDPNPDWYKTCFDDLDGAGCSWQGSAWMETEIQYTIHDLMNNLDNYNTIYLEDPTLNYEHYATEYISLLEDWVSEGNVLILSEHLFCSEQSGSHGYNSYRCDGPGSNDNNWEAFGVYINQRFGATCFPNQYNAVVVETNEAFDFSVGDQLSFEERPYVNIMPTGEATDFTIVANYGSSGSIFNCRFWLLDSKNQPAIAHWDYGDGKIFYFGDFWVNYINVPEKEFSGTLINLISIAYYLVAHPEQNSDIICSFSAFAPYRQVYGDIIIKNEDNNIILENVGNASINQT